MKKLYIQPQTTDVTALLGADILEGGDTLGGQSYNPAGKDRDKVDWSGKQNPFFEDDEEAGLSKPKNVWDK